jgi:hypothetical protein
LEVEAGAIVALARSGANAFSLEKETFLDVDSEEVIIKALGSFENKNGKIWH